MNNLIKSKYFIALLALIIGLALGSIFFGSKNENQRSDDKNQAISKEEIWTCSMHPQIKQGEPGQCPICGMDLIPMVEHFDENDDPLAISMSPLAMNLANIQTSMVERKIPIKWLRVNGKVTIDERGVYSQTSHLSGRVEVLKVNYTGEYVSKGQVLAKIYSPQLEIAQEELLEANKSKSEFPRLFEAAKGKLRNWKLTENQIESIVKNEESSGYFPIMADVSGVVAEKMINEGAYIKEGQTLFKVTDLSKAWVLFDIYESDISWVKKGDSVEFSLLSFPGKKLKGAVSFMDPILDPKARVARARVEFENKELDLKPEMLVSGIIKSKIDEKEKIIVPKSAVMWTGERSIVYVKQNSKTKVSFLLREVQLGLALGEGYLINHGLREMEEIVTNGAFSVDAAAQLAGKPSMMSPKGGISPKMHNHGTNSQSKSQSMLSNHNHKKANWDSSIKSLFKEYFSLKDALVVSDLNKAKIKSSALGKSIPKIGNSAFQSVSDKYSSWNKEVLQNTLNDMGNANSLKEIRFGFQIVSELFIQLLEVKGSMGDTAYIQFCPMVNDNFGANWISEISEIRNPYYGENMLTCGEVIKQINQ